MGKGNHSFCSSPRLICRSLSIVPSLRRLGSLRHLRQLAALLRCGAHGITALTSEEKGYPTAIIGSVPMVAARLAKEEVMGISGVHITTIYKSKTDQPVLIPSSRPLVLVLTFMDVEVTIPCTCDMRDVTQSRPHSLIAQNSHCTLLYCTEGSGLSSFQRWQEDRAQSRRDDPAIPPLTNLAPEWRIS